MNVDENRDQHRCPLHITRRDFISTAGILAAATVGYGQTQLMEMSSTLLNAYPAAKPARKARICVGFVRPDVKGYWMGWPGAAYDIKARQRQYSKVLTAAARKFGVELELLREPLGDDAAVDALLGKLQKNAPDGLIIVSMCLHHPGFSSWEKTNRIAKERGEIPTIVFSPMGTSFTGDLRGTRDIPGVFCAATQDIDWLGFAVRMLNAVNQMKNTRICIVRRGENKDVKLDVIGTTLHYIPNQRFLDELEKVEVSKEIRAMAELYGSKAKMIVEPNRQDLLNAAKNYVVCRRLMAAEDCQGFSMDCLGPVSRREIQPPCLAFSRLRDEGGLGTCEADWNAAISTRLTNLLFDRPGFMQDPAPNTVKNTLMGAHCTCATRLHGFDKPRSPFILRSHSESNIGVAMQVLWPIGERVTVMKFTGPDTIILGTGTVLGNIDTPPAGGCRTSVELELDDVPDVRDTKGFHQLFICGDVEKEFKAYCQVAGIKVVHI